MIDLAITSFFFIGCLFFGPWLMAQNLRLRRGLFLVVCLCLFLLSLNNSESLAAIAIFIIFPYCYVYCIQKWNAPVWPAIIVQLLLFIYINKYTWILSVFGVPVPFFISILGVSYIFFRQLDVLFQVRAELVQTVPLIDYLSYLLSFWTILAGPIQRYREFVKEFNAAEPLADTHEILKNLHRAANGFLKILIFGALFKFVADMAYTSMVDNGYSLLYLVIILYCYPLFVYFNFSGYCDIMIAMGRLAGFTIPENFDRPYLSRDMIEMWNRWHITLSQWLRDYVYQPLFKSLLTGPFRSHLSFSQYLSIFITFFLVGIWHGTTINFVVFGLLQGLGMAISMVYRDQCKKRLGKSGYIQYYNNKKVECVERFITLNFWCFTFLFLEYDVLKMSGFILKAVGV